MIKIDLKDSIKNSLFAKRKESISITIWSVSATNSSLLKILTPHWLPMKIKATIIMKSINNLGVLCKISTISMSWWKIRIALRRWIRSRILMTQQFLQDWLQITWSISQINGKAVTSLNKSLLMLPTFITKYWAILWTVNRSQNLS